MANSVDLDQTALSDTLVYKILGHLPYSLLFPTTVNGSKTYLPTIYVLGQ